MTTFTFSAGNSPLLISIPHGGTQVPSEIAEQFSDSAQSLPDTDWHLDRLYAWTTDLGANLLVATQSRYVVDLNRPPDDHRLYQTPTTGLFPDVQFDGHPIYRPGYSLSADQQKHRLDEYYLPYHQQLANSLERLKREHGYALLFDAHSIRSEVSRLFEGRLPELNIGTNDGRSCASRLSRQLEKLVSGQKRFSFVVNGRFKGGYITRHYGQPKNNIHAVQLEIAQRAYMTEDEPTAFQEEQAAALRALLRDWVQVLLNWQP